MYSYLLCLLYLIVPDNKFRSWILTNLTLRRRKWGGRVKRGEDEWGDCSVLIKRCTPRRVQRGDRGLDVYKWVSSYYHGGRAKRKLVKRSLIEKSLHKRLDGVLRLSCYFQRISKGKTSYWSLISTGLKAHPELKTVCFKPVTQYFLENCVK